MGKLKFIVIMGILLIATVFLSGCINQIEREQCPPEIVTVLKQHISNSAKLANNLYNGNLILERTPQLKIGSDYVWTGFVGAICPKGSLEGENVNYNYCGRLGYIEHQVISQEGVVGKKTMYEVYGVIINPKNFDVIELKCEYSTLMNA